MEVVSYKSSMRDEWDAVIADGPNGTFLQSRGFLDLQRSRVSEASYVVTESRRGSRRLVAVLPGVRHVHTYVSHPGATHAGVVTAASLGLRDSSRLVAEIGNRLRQDGASSWCLTPVPLFLRRVPWEGDLFGYWQIGCQLVGRGGSGYVPAGERIGRSKNRKIAARAGLAVGEAADASAAFALINSVVRNRHGVDTTHTLAEFIELYLALPEHVRVYEALSGNRIVAAAVVFRFPTCLHFQYMGANDEGRAMQALDGLVEYVWRRAHSENLGLSFGVSTTDSGRVLNPGLANFKEGFGALPRTIDSYEIAL